MVPGRTSLQMAGFDELLPCLWFIGSEYINIGTHSINLSRTKAVA